MRKFMKRSNGSDVIVMGVIAIVALAVALVIGVDVTSSDPQHSESTPLISMLVAVVPLTITSLLALMRTSDTHREASQARQVAEETKAVAEQTHKDLTNGVLTANMRAAIRAVALEDDVEISTRVRNGEPNVYPLQIFRTDGDIPGAPGHDDDERNPG